MSSKSRSEKPKWISHPFEVLVEKHLNKPSENNQEADYDFDVIVIGSGYGGAIAAQAFSKLSHQGKPLSLAVLERGREYLPGSFPSGLSDVFRHIRFSSQGNSSPKGEQEGLFDLRLGEDVNAVLGNGLGGGSLINAGVMERASESVFSEGWPSDCSYSALEPYYHQAEVLLGVRQKGGSDPSSVDRNQPQVDKLAAIENLSDKGAPSNRGIDAIPTIDALEFEPAAVTVAFENGVNRCGVYQDACIACGDCVTGCNIGAKKSLDTHLLYEAYKQGAEIYTGATVDTVSQLAAELWEVKVNYTDERLRKRQGEALRLKAKKVIVAAGTYGSTEILLRSRNAGLALSERLGSQFSGNGDMIAVEYGRTSRANSFAFEGNPLDQRNIGPTISGVIRARVALNQDAKPNRSDWSVVADTQPTLFTIEDISIPATLSPFFQEVIATSLTLHDLTRINSDIHQDGFLDKDPCAIDDQAFENTMVYALMGDDGAAGQIMIPEDSEPGSAYIKWPELKHSTLFDEQMACLEALGKNAGTGGRLIANPFWRLLPESMAALIDGQKGPALTVHPLGGCAMADNASEGVVNADGQVFTGLGDHVYDGLVILDGAIIPKAISTNPALTISAVALRAIEALEKKWDLAAASSTDVWKITHRPNVWQASGHPVLSTKDRPVLHSRAFPLKRTKVQVIERMTNTLVLELGGIKRRYHVQLSLVFQPIIIDEIIRHQSPVLNLIQDENDLSSSSYIRIISEENYLRIRRSGASYEDCEKHYEQAAELIAPLSGELRLLTRRHSTQSERQLRATWAWLLNRGIRDTWQWAEEEWFGDEQSASSNGVLDAIKASWFGVSSKAMDAFKLSSHAGEMRLMEYQLRIEAPWQSASEDWRQSFAGQTLSGEKRISYSRRVSPLRQFTEMHVLSFPFYHQDSQRDNKHRFNIQKEDIKSVFELDTSYLSHVSVPLLRIVEHENLVNSYADLISLACYIFRLLLRVHLWSFRKPDAPSFSEPERLPQAIKGLPEPEISELECGRTAEGGLIKVRLTRYANRETQLPPLATLHGYSTSGNTYTHHSIDTNFAEYFWQSGRDVWVLDLRTSSGMPTANMPWTFEQASFVDIPLAIDFIYQNTGQRNIDVFAHCMGSVMLSMAILADKTSAWSSDTAPYLELLRALPKRLNRLVLCQVAPLFRASPANGFRGYMLDHIRHMLPAEDYQFEQSKSPGLMEQLLDRVLSAYPRSDTEFDLENPYWMPYRNAGYASFRRRMDALYERDFTLKNLSRKTQDHIEELFGTLNMETLYQTLHFNRNRSISDPSGQNVYTSIANFREKWNFPTFSIHGEDNDLSDVSTVFSMQEAMQQAGVDFEYEVFSGLGHQDGLIGKSSAQVFARVERFLDSTRPKAVVRGDETHKFSCHLPWLGPIVGQSYTDETNQTFLPITLGKDPGLMTCHYIALIDDMDTFIPCIEKQCTEHSIPQTDLFTLIPANFDKFGVMRCDIPLEHSASQLSKSTSKRSKNAGVFLLELNQIERPEVLGESDLSEAYDAICQALKSLPASQIQIAQVKLPTPSGCFQQADVAKGLSGFNFIHASCQFTAGMLDQSVAFRSYERIAELLKPQDYEHAPRCMTLVGDQVYVDPSDGLFDAPNLQERYLKPYQRWLRQASVREVLRQIPSHMMLDDHEIKNDWDPIPNDEENQRLLEEGIAQFKRFQTSSNPAFRKTGAANKFWYDFQAEGYDFFMLDTRSERDERKVTNIDSAQIIGFEQMKALLKWLFARRHSFAPKFIASPSTILPRQVNAIGAHANAIRSDAWGGFPHSFNRLLSFIAKYQIPNVVFLCGDEHISSFSHAKLSSTKLGPKSSEAENKRPSVDVYSIVSSGLYSPFPFANTRPWQLMGNESFEVTHPKAGGISAQCEINTRFTEGGDGFAKISVEHSEQGYSLSVEFALEPKARYQYFDVVLASADRPGVIKVC